MRWRWLLAAGLAAVCLGAASPAGSATVPGGLLRATELLLDLDLDRAEGACRGLPALPEAAAARAFCLGLVSLARAEEQDDPRPELDRFLEQTAEAAEAAEALERLRPADAELRLLLGLIHGSRALAEGSRGNSLAALRALAEAHRRLREALALDPALVDARYGLGLAALALERLPGLLRPLVGLFLPAGEPGEGRRELERVAAEGRYLKGAAQVALLHLYAAEEPRQYGAVLRLGRELLARYPGNPDLHFAAALAASELGRHAEAAEIARRIGEQLAAGRAGFRPGLEARRWQLLGKLAMDRGEEAAALALFRRTIQTPTPARYRWVTAWAWTRSGMIHDRQGAREEALRCYRQALAVQPGGRAGEAARRYLETPYPARPHPGPTG